MRRVLLCLFPPCLLAAAPFLPCRPAARDRPAPEVRDDGQALPDDAALACMAHHDPVAFLRACLMRHEREVRGYTLVMRKQERLGGRLRPPEVVRVAFREKPHAVYLEWRQGARLAERALYVADENGGKMLARPATRLLRLAGDVVARDVEGAEAARSGRYPLNQFGLRHGTLRTLASWEGARRENALHVAYLGARDVPEVGGRPCHVFRRAPYARPEEDGITELTAYIDTTTWLQVGSVLRGEGGQLIGEYYFRDVCLNPDIPDEQFTPAALRP